MSVERASAINIKMSEIKLPTNRSKKDTGEVSLFGEKNILAKTGIQVALPPPPTHTPAPA